MMPWLFFLGVVGLILGGCWCCGAFDCQRCDDPTLSVATTKVMVDLSGWSNGTSGTTCASYDGVEELNIEGAPVSGDEYYPVAACDFDVARDTDYPLCMNYRTSQSPDPVNVVRLTRFMVYVTTGGDLRGLLLLTLTEASAFKTVRDDFLVATGATTFDCLAFTRTGTLTTCDSAGTLEACEPPTDYTLTIEAR